MGLGTLLKEYSSINGTAYQSWSRRNQNIRGVVAALKKYAYRPFSTSTDSNLIDSRSFFHLRDFIYEMQSQNRTVAFITTWIMDLSEDRVLYYKGVAMPFNLNNVDLTVSANVLYGLTSGLLSGLIEVELFDDDLQMIYESTISMMVWEMSHNFSARPDLAFVYYPSIYNFFWFTSRILNLLNRFEKLPLPFLYKARSMLSIAMRSNATEYILNNAVEEEDKYVYFDDFLGDADKDILGM